MTGTAKQIIAALAGVASGAAIVTALGVGDANASDGGRAVPVQDRAAIEAIVRDYILNHPEILPQAMERLQHRETSQLLEGSRKALETPFPGASAGAATADVTMVMFTDYSCGFCRASVADVDRLLAEDKALRVVWRELPILGPNSDRASRASLAAARQGRYADFHRALFAAGQPTEGKIATVGREIGLDAAQARQDAAAAATTTEIDTNLALARKLGLSGTPSFVIGERLLTGAVGYAELKKAIAEARTAKGTGQKG